MYELTINRPATIYLTTKVKAETVEEALELADIEFSNGEYKEDEDSFSIDYETYFAIDEYKCFYTNEKLETENQRATL